MSFFLSECEEVGSQVGTVLMKLLQQLLLLDGPEKEKECAQEIVNNSEFLKQLQIKVLKIADTEPTQVHHKILDKILQLAINLVYMDEVAPALFSTFQSFLFSFEFIFQNPLFHSHLEPLLTFYCNLVIDSHEVKKFILKNSFLIDYLLDYITNGKIERDRSFDMRVLIFIANCAHQKQKVNFDDDVDTL